MRKSTEYTKFSSAIVRLVLSAFVSSLNNPLSTINRHMEKMEVENAALKKQAAENWKY